MKKFKIEVISKKPEKIDGLLSYWGRITIGDFTERFVMPLNSWSLDEYKQQWQEGIERIKTHNVSCLVTVIQNLTKNPLIEIWALYKENDTIFFQNMMLTREIVKELNLPFKLSEFNAKTCYELVDYPRKIVTENGNKISEWNIGMADFFSSLNSKVEKKQ